MIAAHHGADGVRVDPDRLRAIELFSGLTDGQLAWLATRGTKVTLNDGTVLFEDGEEGNHFYVLLAGGLLITKMINGEEQVVSRHFIDTGAVGPDSGDKPAAASQYTGELPLLAGGCYVATGTTVGQTEAMVYDRAEFFDILARCPQVFQVLLPVLAWRIKSYEHQSRHSTLLEGLGTLAAGLAHELNNPAAAVARAAHELTGAIGEFTSSALTWGAESTPAERDILSRLRATIGSGDPFAAAETSERIVGILRARGVRRPQELALVLADCGFDPEELGRLNLRPEIFETAMSYLACLAQARMFAEEVAEGSSRIVALISSVKDYTNVGRAPLRDVRLSEGIDATLTMMAPKLLGIRINRQYDDIPSVSGYPGELNQVWTNLIDNAVDAMDGRGELRIRIFREGVNAVVEFGDNGPGIPPKIMTRLFQPFFTTKDIGKGTGLGLHLSRDIVVHRHNGYMDVASVPGDTRFSVYLPMGPRRGQHSAM